MPRLNIYIGNPDKKAGLKLHRRRRSLIIGIIGCTAILFILFSLLLIIGGGNDTYEIPGLINKGNDKKGNTVDVGETRDYGDIVICLDPGHGYDDPGTGSAYLGEYYEKDINLDICLRLRDLLTACGYNVRMTREDDMIPADYDISSGMYVLNPQARAEIANSIDGLDLFVSVHCNSYENDSSVSGSRIYYYEKNTSYTALLARDVADKIYLRTKGLEPRISSMSRSDAYYILKYVSVPAILIETGFVTNEIDAADMLDEE